MSHSLFGRFDAVFDLGLISTASLGPRASTKVESHVNFTESLKVFQPIYIFFAMLNTKKLANFNHKHFQFKLSD